MSAWAVAANLPKPANLVDIMEEQQFLTSDLSVAEELNFEEMEAAGGPSHALGVYIEDEDADLAFALALQEQLFEEERSIASRSSGNVRTAFPEDLCNGGGPFGDATLGCSEDEAVDGVVVEKALRAYNQKRRVKGVDVGGRVSAKDFMSTQQGVLDRATSLIVFKMLQNGTLSDFQHGFKTGKEACVFYGVPDLSSKQNEHVCGKHFSAGCAVKIFKTTLNEFSNRADYFDGDHRFGKFNKIGKTRAAIAKWAEKEFRNLARVNKKSKILAPQALTFKEHVIVMSFIGSGGVPAPQLRETSRSDLTPPQWQEKYLDVMAVIHSLYHDCSLVHGDLSEYNLLLHEGDVYVIDFGQAVDISHPDHISFMYRDIKTINDYFEKQGARVLDVETALATVLQSVEALDIALSSEAKKTAAQDIEGCSSTDMSCWTDETVQNSMIKKFLLFNID